MGAEQITVLRWTDWSADPMIVGGLAAAVLAYLRLARRYPPGNRRGAYFWLGVLTLAVALLSPLDRGAEDLFALHMAQHMLLLMIAPPLLVLAVPPGLLGWVYRRPLLWRAYRAVWSPIPAFVLYNGALLLWHVPGPYDATLAVPWIHAAEHLSFVAAGVVFWGVIASPSPKLVRAPLLVRLGMLIGTNVLNFFLGAALTFSTHPWYAPYAAAPRLWGITPLADQHMGGLLMWVGGEVLFAVPVLVLLYWFVWRRSNDRLLPAAVRGAAAAARR